VATSLLALDNVVFRLRGFVSIAALSDSSESCCDITYLICKILVVKAKLSNEDMINECRLHRYYTDMTSSDLLAISMTVLRTSLATHIAMSQ